jgi:poly [ADP-ribose] polymerase
MYFAPSSTKSLNYAEGYWGGGSRTQSMFMFLNDVAVGKDYTPAGTHEQLPKAGYDSTWAKAKQSGVYNDEVIVYTTDQCNPTFLCEFQ